MKTEPTQSPPGVAPRRLVVPAGIFERLPEWDQIAKQKAVREWLETLPVAAIFPNGVPKRKPAKTGFRSTCGCWQCAFCHKIILKRALRDVRRDHWHNATTHPTT